MASCTFVCPVNITLNGNVVPLEVPPALTRIGWLIVRFQTRFAPIEVLIFSTIAGSILRKQQREQFGAILKRYVMAWADKKR